MENRSFEHLIHVRIIFLTIAIIFQSTLISAQSQYTVNGRVVDKISGEPIPEVHVRGVGDRKSTTTTNTGSFTLKGSPIDLKVLTFSHVSYESFELELDFATDSISKLEIALRKKSIQVPEAIIREQRPDTVFGQNAYHALDYLFTNDRKLLVLTYESQKYFKRQSDSEIDLYNDCRLLLVGENNVELDSLQIKTPSGRLVIDYRNVPYILGNREIYRIRIDKQNQLSLDKVNMGDYEEYIDPVIDSVGSFLFYSNQIPDFSAFDYLAMDLKDTVPHVVHHIEDELQMKMHRATYRDLKGRGKLMAFRKELETGIDKEIIAGYMSGFTSSPFCKQVYAPLFVIRDTVLIFDYYSSSLLKKDTLNNTLDSVQISHHLDTGGLNWEKLLLKDKQKNEIFAVYERNGFKYLKLINQNTGAPEYTFKLTHRYPENLLVFDNKVYYIYRPFGSLQKKFLYSEKLPVYK